MKQLSVKGSWDLAVPTQLCRTLQGPLALPAWAMGGNVPAVISLPPIVFSRRPRRRGGGTPLIPLPAKPRWPTSSSGARGVPADADHRRGAPCLCPAASLRPAVAQLERGSRLCSRAGDRRGPLHGGRRRARAGARGSGLGAPGSGLGARLHRPWRVLPMGGGRPHERVRSLYRLSISKVTGGSGSKRIR